MSSERSVKDLSGPYIKRLVGANGFEPSTSWSRTRHLNPINALFGVAYGTRSVISPLSVVPNLYLEFGVTPCSERGFLCSLASLLPCCTSACSPESNHRRWSIAGRIVSESFTDTLAPA